MTPFAANFSSYSLIANKQLFLQINSWVAICCPDLQMFQMSEMNFHLKSSDKVSETIHRHKKLPLTIHLQVLDLYLETAETKHKKM